MEANLTSLVYNGEEFAVPSILLKDKDVFDHVMSHDTWSTILSEEERTSLCKFLPEEMSENQKQETIRMMFDKDNFSFGNPIDQTWNKVSTGRMSCDIEPLHDELKNLKYESYKQNMKHYHIKLLQELLLSTRRLMKNALETGGLDNISTINGRKDDWRLSRKRGNIVETVSMRAEEKYRKIVRDCRQACDLSPDHESSDEERTATSTNQFNEEDYLRMLKEHKKKRRMKMFSPELDTRGITMSSVIGGQPPSLQLSNNEKDTSTKQHSSTTTKTESSSKKTSHSATTPSFNARKVNYASKTKERRKWDGLFEGKGCIYEVYKDPSKLKVDKAEPIILEGPLPSGKFTSYFAMLKKVFESLNDHKGDVNKITEVVQMYLDSPECRTCEWITEQPSWSDLVLSALCYLGAEVGAVSTFEPLPHFYPIVDFRDRIDHWKWSGNKRDSDIELLVLCDHWKANLDRALSVVDYTDYSPLPSLVSSSNIVKSSKSYEVDKFQQLEQLRYSAPQKAFTYLVQGYEAAVGPVKGVKGGAVKKEQGSRAREHFLLKSERPNCVTILSLVRDACSRLPNGEGTRLDICILLKDSQFVADNVTDSQLNNAVSGALDRLHYEKDPCVRYISSKKMWIYLHRNRTEDEFEHIGWACESASKNRKVIMSRIKLTPKILLKEPSGKMVDMSPQPGDTTTTPTFGKTKSSPKIPRSQRNTNSSSSRVPKTPKSLSKRGVKKGQQTTPSIIKPPITTEQEIDSDSAYMQQEKLPMLSTTNYTSETVADHNSSSDDDQISFNTLSGNEEYISKCEPSTNTAVTPWLTAGKTEEYSDSYMTE